MLYVKLPSAIVKSYASSIYLILVIGFDVKMLLKTKFVMDEFAFEKRDDEKLLSVSIKKMLSIGRILSDMYG
jgi:general stress protein CsbA